MYITLYNASAVPESAGRSGVTREVCWSHREGRHGCCHANLSPPLGPREGAMQPGHHTMFGLNFRCEHFEFWYKNADGIHLPQQLLQLRQQIQPFSIPVDIRVGLENVFFHSF